MRTKLEIANTVLKSFCISQLEHTENGYYVSWTIQGKTTRKRWQCRGQDFYPVWSQSYPGGGTSCTALSQLIRWCAGRPVLPLSTWRRWASETVKLLPRESVDFLLENGYPEHVQCVLCNQTINGGLDWWSLDKVSGPCCGWTTGCRQKGKDD